MLVQYKSCKFYLRRRIGATRISLIDRTSMRFSILALTAVTAFVQEVAAHGYVPQIKIGSQYITGWNVNTDGYATPRVSPSHPPLPIQP